MKKSKQILKEDSESLLKNAIREFEEFYKANELEKLPLEKRKEYFDKFIAIYEKRQLFRMCQYLLDRKNGLK